MRQALNKKSVAVLAADAVGYSNAVGTDEALALGALANSRKLIDGLIDVHAGRIFNTAGDSVLAEFTNPPAAVRCAFAIQTALRVGEGDGPCFVFRIGVSAGEVIVEGRDLLGGTVNLAARLEAIAPAGGICVSQAVYDAAAHDRAEKWEDLGLRHLKNLIEPVRVFRFVPTGASPLPVIAEARKPVVMVLPFANRGGLVEETYLSEGITEDVIAGLSRFGSLAVLGMTSTNAYREHEGDRLRLAAEMGVEYVVRGSVSRSGDAVRLRVQLVGARSGLTLWAERYERIIDNLFSMQDEIVETVVSALAGQLEGDARASAARKRTENMEAYDFLLRGIHLARALDPHSASAALAAFEKALALDPEYALALAWSALMKLRLRAWVSDAYDSEEMVAPARKALAIDPSESWCHLVYGQIMMYLGQLVEAEQHHQRAYELNPFDAHVMALRAPLSVYLGKPAEGERWARRAMQLNPLHPDWYVTNLGLALYCLRQYERAVQTYLKIAEPQVGVLAGLAASYAQLGDVAGAKATRDRLLELAPGFSTRRFLGSKPFLHADDQAHLRHGLERAGLPS